MEGLGKEDREKMEREIYAPAQGWAAAQANLFANIQAAGEEED
jgi:hypothetical protein